MYFPKALRWLLLTICSLPACLFAQSTDPVFEKIANTLEQRAAHVSNPGLFLHIDKSIYVNNENIWFTAYLLNSLSAKDYHTLHVVLVQRATQSTVASQRIVIEEGIGKGYLFINDSIPTGEYELLAYTNTLLSGSRSPVFSQFISIKSNGKTAFDLTTKFDTLHQRKDSVAMICRITTDYGGFATGGDFRYQLYSNGQQLQSGRAKVNAFGEVPIQIAGKHAMEKMELLAQVERDKKKQFFTIPIVRAPQQLAMTFYPESGNLVALQHNRIAFEIRRPNGAGVAVKGVVLENEDTAARFESNAYGQGTFYIVPNAKATYSIRLAASEHVLQYNFPEVSVTGYTLEVPQAIVNDSLSLNLYTSHIGRRCYIMLHDYREIFYTVNVMVRDKGSLVIPTGPCPDGIKILTVFDDQGRPQAERTILVKHNKQITATIEADSNQYHRRSMVQLKIKVTGDDGKGIPALFSFAAIFDKRIDSTRFIDIVRFKDFDQYLPHPLALPPTGYFTDAKAVELLLLTAFWTRYKWHEMEAPLTQAAKHHAEIYGYVRYKNKPLRQPAELLALSTGFHSFATDSTGNFDIPFDAVRTSADNNILLSLAQKKMQTPDYSILLKNDYDHVNDSLAALYKPLPAGFQKDTLTTEERDILKQAGPAKTLQTVVVTSKKSGDDYVARPPWKNPCDDYVCMYNILNCPNHPFSGMKPIEGVTYTYMGRSIVYRDECQGKTVPLFMQKVKGTFYTKEFYEADYQKLNPPDPETNSTLLWKHQVVTNSNGEATIPFYTNDLTGKITCILQGVSSKGVISARTSFRVTRD